MNSYGMNPYRYAFTSLCIHIVGTGLAPVRERVPIALWSFLCTCANHARTGASPVPTNENGPFECRLV